MENEHSWGDSKKLGVISFVTAFGDFLTYFSVIKLVYALHGDALSAAFGGVGIGSAAAIVSGLTSPWLKRHFNTKTLIVSSQIISFFVVATLLYFVSVETQNTYLLFSVLFLKSFFSKIFEVSRETHTHGLNDGTVAHRQIQSILLSGLYQAQFLGPLVAYLMLSYFAPQIPVFVDLLTFLIASLMAFTLHKGKVLSERLSVFNAVAYLNLNSQIRKLFFLRTAGFWIPASFFNMMIYENAADRLGLGVEYSGVVYSVIGMGALVSATLLRGNVKFVAGLVDDVKDRNLAALANLGFALVVVMMILSGNVVWNTACYFIYGSLMGMNAVTTQSIRRQLCSPNQLSEMIGLEVLLSFAIQFVLTFLIGQYMSLLPNPLMVGLGVIVVCSSVVALLYCRSGLGDN